MGDPVALFWSKVDKNGPVPPHRPELGPCWVWQAGFFDDGYPAFHPTGKKAWRGKRLWRGNRFALVIKLGRDLGDGMHALHECDNPSCVRPEHLFEGTELDNARDRDRKGRRRQGSAANAARGDRNGARRHPERVARGERHGVAKLDEHTVVAIRAWYSSGSTLKETAAKFGIAFSHVHRIVKRLAWAHVP